MKQIILILTALLLSLSSYSQVNKNMFFSEEYNYGLDGYTYVFQGSRWWTNNIDCNDMHCTWGTRFFPFNRDGYYNGRRVSVYSNALDNELIVYKDGSKAILNFNWINGEFRNKLILK